MRIAHLSDLHLCSLFKENNFLKLEKAIVKGLELGAQHFVFTGDITDNANINELKKFKDLLKKLKIYNSNTSTLTIGNHDIFGGPQTASDVISFPSKCFKVDYNEKVKIFIDFFKELFEGAITSDENFSFPFLKIVNDNALIIINSIDEYSRFKNPFASNGRIRKDVRQKISKLLNHEKTKNKIKISVIHHHFYHKNEIVSSSENSLWSKVENYTMKLRNKKKILKLFKEHDVKIVLHGHSHEMKEYYRDNIHFFNSGGAFEGNALRMFIINAFNFDQSYELIENNIFVESEDKLKTKLAI